MNESHIHPFILYTFLLNTKIKLLFQKRDESLHNISLLIIFKADDYETDVAPTPITHSVFITKIIGPSFSIN